MKCPNCGGEILHGMPMCPRCGQRVSTQAQRGKYCIHCKAVIPATAAVCPKCGKSQVQQAQQKQKPQKKSGGFRWWYVPIMLLLVMVGYVIGFSSRPQVQTKEPSKSNNSSSKAKEEASKESKPESKEENASQSEKDDVPQVEAVPLNDTEIREMYSDPDKYTGRAVKLTGKVFGDVEYSEGSVGFQMYADPSNNSMNTIVGYYGDDLTVTEGAFVKISGIVLSKFEGSNAFGGAVTAPMILAQSAEIVSYQEAVSPTIKEVVPESNSQTQLGYTVTVQKVELAASETRVYLKVDNNGSSKFNLYSFNSKLVQNGKQYEEQRNYKADYPEVQTDLLSGVSTEGIICFPAIENTDFQLIFEGRSDNYMDESFEPYTFNVTVGQGG